MEQRYTIDITFVNGSMVSLVGVHDRTDGNAVFRYASGDFQKIWVYPQVNVLEVRATAV